MLVLAVARAAPLRAADSDLDRFKAEIDAFVGRLGPSSNGVVRWESADPFEIRRDGGALVAVITNARLAVGIQKVDQLTLDRVEIRQIGQKEDGKLIELSLNLPREMTLSEGDGAATKIALKDGTATTLIEAQSGRGRETAIAISSVRLDQPDTGAWVSIGPLSMTSKLIAEPNGGWTGPVEFAVTNIEYFLPQIPLGGGVERIAFSGRSTGPSLDALNELRDALDGLQADDRGSPEARGAAFLALLPSIAPPFGSISSEFAVNGVTVRSVTGEALLSLTKAETAGSITGLDGEAAALRFSIHHEGLELAPSILDRPKVPHHLIFDVGISDISTQALGQLLRAASTIRSENGVGENENGQKEQQAVGQLLGAAAMLNPAYRVYDIAVDTEDVGVGLTGEARGSPLAPNGYTASADLVVRGFDAIPKLGVGIPFAEYLPVLKELGNEQTASDGTARIDFRLRSAPPKWLTINDNDVWEWFDEAEAKPGQWRLLKPSDPPMQGGDVEGVQRALAGSKIAVEQDGIYRPSTAAAVARFQKQNRINVSGVVDAPTRQRLGLPVDMPRQDGRN